MKREEQYELLEKCIQQVEAGRPLESVLAETGSRAAELRPLLEAALWARSLNSTVQVPAAAQNRSRARFLAAAGRPETRPSWLPRLRFSTAALVLVLAVLFTALLGSGLASAASLPGDTFYPLKRAVEQARLSLASGPASRLALEESFDEERVQESRRLLQLGRAQNVSFAGVLQKDDEHGWEVSELPVVLSAEQEALAEGLNGLYVLATGRPAGEQVIVTSIEVRLFEFSGKIDSARSDRWVINGIPVGINERTQLLLQPQPGAEVHVTAVRQADSGLLALLIAPGPFPAAVTFQPPSSSATAAPTSPILQPTAAQPTTQPTLDDHGGDKTDTPEIEDTPEPDHSGDDHGGDNGGGDDGSEDKSGEDNSGGGGGGSDD